MISRLSVRFSSIADNGGLGEGAAGRCRQIRIWLHRAGRARSQKREMKFDRSDRDPLSLGSSLPISDSPAVPVSGHLARLVTRSQPRELQNGVGTHVPRVSAPSGCPTGTDGQHRARCAPLFPSLRPAHSWRTPFYTILFYLLPPCRCRHRRRRLCSLGGIR